MATLRGSAVMLAIAINTLLMGVPILLLALLKPIPGLNTAVTRINVALGERWGLNNGAILRAAGVMRVTARGLERLSRDGWYLVLSNHQSWVDILILHCTLTGRISPIKFFLKRQMIWLPIVGVACWALDFPFMRRYSQEYLQQHPEKRALDLETTRRACERFSKTPSSLLNFAEGTRFTREKHERQQSPFHYLLKPKPGGFAYVIGAMGERIDHIVDATIVYPHGTPTFWSFLCGRCPDVLLYVDTLPLPRELLGGDYREDPEYRRQVRDWLGALWQAKDARIAAALAA